MRKIICCLIIQGMLLGSAVPLAVAGEIRSVSLSREMLSPRVGISTDLPVYFTADNPGLLAKRLFSFDTASESVNLSSNENSLERIISQVIREFKESGNEYKYFYLPDLVPLMNQGQMTEYFSALSDQISIYSSDIIAEMIRNTAENLAGHTIVREAGFDARDFFAHKLLNQMIKVYRKKTEGEKLPSTFGLYSYFRIIGRLAGEDTYADLKQFVLANAGGNKVARYSESSAVDTVLRIVAVISLGELRFKPESEIYDFLFSCARMPDQDDKGYTLELKGAANVALGSLAARFLVDNPSDRELYLSIYEFLRTELSSPQEYEPSLFLYPTVGAALGLGAMLTGRQEDWLPFFYVGFDSLYYVTDHPYFKRLLLKEGEFISNAKEQLDAIRFDQYEKLSLLKLIMLHEKYLKEHGLLQNEVGTELLKKTLEDPFLGLEALDGLKLVKKINPKAALPMLLKFIEKNRHREYEKKSAIELLAGYNDPVIIQGILDAYRFQKDDSRPEEAIICLSRFQKEQFDQSQWQQYEELIEFSLASGKDLDGSFLAIARLGLKSFEPYLKHYLASDNEYTATLAGITLAILKRDFSEARRHFAEGKAIMQHAAELLEIIMAQVPEKKREGMLAEILQSNQDKDVRKTGIRLLAEMVKRQPEAPSEKAGLKKRLTGLRAAVGSIKRLFRPGKIALIDKAI